MEHAERETRAAPPAAARASRVRDAGARSALQARFDESPRVRALQAKAGSPAVQRMVIKVGTVDDGIREDAANISKAGGGAEVSQWSAVAQLGNGETLHVVGHLEEGTMDGKDAAALAAEVAPHLQGKTDVTVDLHGCFAANPGALEAEADDLWASYAGKFQKALAGLLGSNVPVVASLGAEYTSSGGETRVREGSYVKQDVDDAVKLESGRLVGPGTKPGLAHARAATDAVIEGTRSEGLFLRQGEGRLVFKDAKTDAIDKGDGGALEDLEGAWDPRAYRIQAKLEVGAADDAYEREADRMARHAIARMYAPQAAHEDADVTPAGDGVQMKATPLRRHGGAEAFDAPDHVESAIGSARGSGSPLPEALRAPLESSLGADFSGVRVHSDARAHALNQSIQAKAFTTGQDVFFRQGAYQPGSRSGQELLAHELTHVVQQGGADVARRPEEERIQRMPAWRKAPEAPDGKYDASSSRSTVSSTTTRPPCLRIRSPCRSWTATCAGG